MDTRSSELQLLKKIQENLGSSVLLFDTRLRIAYMNSAAEILFHVSAKHMLEQPANLLHGAAGDLLEPVIQHAMELGRAITERELRLQLHDGREITVDCTVIPLLDSREVLVEIQQIDRQLKISREEKLLTQQQTAMELVRGLAHEIKNPLGGLRGAAQLLEGELADPELSEYTQIIINEADRLQQLVDRMLGSNRLPQLKQVNVHTLLERVRNLVQAESGPGIEIQRDYDPSIPELLVDSDRIIQALLNILRNAARELKNQVGGRIQLRTRILRQFTIGNLRHRLVVQISIIDNGPGIPDSIREKLFYPMVTASEGGMGLGLSIAQTLIHQHGGLIECQSRRGETEFQVLLPVENPNA